MDRKGKAQVRGNNKKIKKRIRSNKRSTRHEKVQNFLDELKGIRSIASINIRKMKILITYMRNEAGNIEATR